MLLARVFYYLPLIVANLETESEEKEDNFRNIFLVCRRRSAVSLLSFITLEAVGWQRSALMLYKKTLSSVSQCISRDVELSKGPARKDDSRRFRVLFSFSFGVAAHLMCARRVLSSESPLTSSLGARKPFKAICADIKTVIATLCLFTAKSVLLCSPFFVCKLDSIFRPRTVHH